MVTKRDLYIALAIALLVSGYYYVLSGKTAFNFFQAYALAVAGALFGMLAYPLVKKLIVKICL
jgi:uncharacterized oligopeptide transporter (OPT) family protein